MYLTGLGFDPATLMHDFFNAGNKYIDALTWHQYYLAGSKATLADFTDVQVLNRFEEQVC